jgi:hypothetical protein
VTTNPQTWRCADMKNTVDGTCGGPCKKYWSVQALDERHEDTYTPPKIKLTWDEQNHRIVRADNMSSSAFIACLFSLSRNVVIACLSAVCCVLSSVNKTNLLWFVYRLCLIRWINTTYIVICVSLLSKTKIGPLNNGCALSSRVLDEHPQKKPTSSWCAIFFAKCALIVYSMSLIWHPLFAYWQVYWDTRSLELTSGLDRKERSFWPRVHLNLHEQKIQTQIAKCFKKDQNFFGNKMFKCFVYVADFIKEWCFCFFLATHMFENFIQN